MPGWREGEKDKGEIIPVFYILHTGSFIIYDYYGKFVDMGVGRGVTMETVETTNRKPKPWYSKVFWGQFQKIKKLMVEKYQVKSTMSIFKEIDRIDQQIIVPIK